VTEDCILRSIDLNWWDMAYTFADSLLEKGIKLSSAIKNKAYDKKRRVEKLMKTFETRPIVS
jgi:hypothetical protein